MVIRFLLRPAIFICIVIMAACSNDGWEELGNDYAFITTNAHNHSITKNGKVIVYTNVVEHRVEGDIVFGKREESIRPDVGKEFLGRSRYGYFVIDMTSGKVIDGLSVKELEEYRANPDVRGQSND